MTEDEYEYAVSLLLCTATNGKWSKPGKIEDMVRVIEDCIEDRIEKAAEAAIKHHRDIAKVLLDALANIGSDERVNYYERSSSMDYFDAREMMGIARQALAKYKELE